MDFGEVNLGGAPVRAKPEPVLLASSWADRIGICLSALCVVHCLLTPVVLLVLPTLSILGLNQSVLGGFGRLHESFHEAMLLVLPLFAVIAFIPGYRRHRNNNVFYWSLPGFLLLCLALFLGHPLPWLEALLSISGSLFLIKAHFVNRQLCSCCQTHACHPRKRARGAFRAGGTRFMLPEADSTRLLVRPRPRPRL